MKILRVIAPVLFLLVSVASVNAATTVTPSGQFGYTDGTLSGLSGVQFDAEFVYDATNPFFSKVFDPTLAIYQLDAPASVSITVAGRPGLSFTDNIMTVFVENNQNFGGFGWVPAGISDFYYLTGMAPGTVFDPSSSTITSGLSVQLVYAGNPAMLADNGLAPDLPGAVINGNNYDPGFFVVMEQWENGNAIGTAFWNIPVSAVPVPAAVWLFGSGLIGLIGVARCKKA